MKKLNNRQLSKKNGFAQINENYFVHKSGEVYSLKSNKFLAQQDNTYYKSVKIDGKTQYVHHLVAQAFMPIKRKGYVVDHIDHDCHNNNYLNLRYINKSANVKRDRIQKRERANQDFLPFLIENIFFLSARKLSNLTGYSIRHIFHLRKKKKEGLI